MKKRTRRRPVQFSIRVEVERLARVRAYRRIRYGKSERVKSHYRRY